MLVLVGTRLKGGPVTVLIAPEKNMAAETSHAGGRAGAFLMDAFWLLVVVACIPLVILAIGAPLALAVKLVLFLAAML